MTKINTVTESILEEVNKTIKKKGIKNTQLITLSSGAMKGISVYKTGIPPLDIALGVGGIPQGRILEVFGAESSGKTTITLSIIATMQRLGFECAFIDVEHALDRNWAIKCGVDIDNLIFVQPDCVWEGEYIWTKEGAYKIGEYKKDKILSIKDNIYTGGKISKRILSERECYKVTTSRGSVVCSLEHKFKTFFGYKKLKELKVGDTIENVNGDFELTRDINGLKFDRNDAIMAGMLIADGCYCGTTIGYTKLDDIKNIRWIEKYLKDKFPDVKLSQKDIKQYRFINKERSNKVNKFTYYFQGILGKVKGRNKEIPRLIFGNSELMSGLVLGLFSCDSHLEGNKQLSYSTVSKNIIENVKLILSYFNIDYKYRERWNKSKNKEIYCLSLNSRESIENFIRCIGILITSYNNKNIRNIDLDKKESFLKYPVEFWDVIWEEARKKGYNKAQLCRELEPNKKRYGLNDKRMLSLRQLKKINKVLKSNLLENYIHNDIVYSRITSIEKVGYKKCVDIMVPVTNNFICNGFRVHNCGEDALTIAEELVGKVDLSVLDSVSALVPKAELEGEMGDSHMGLQARLMGQAMRKLTGKTSKKNTDIIFINQIRKKIGVTFGSPNTTSGGNALKFYASIRMDIARIGSNKEGEDVVSNNVKIKIVKNKVAPPFKICTAVIDFEHGFDLYANMFPCLLETGVLYKGDAKGKKKQSGNTYYYEDGDKLGVGKPEAMKAFREMFDTESLQVLYENYLDDKLNNLEEKPKKKKKKKNKGKKNGKSKSTD